MNQNPEQLARDRIDEQLTACGWLIQNKKAINLQVAAGITTREYQANVEPADYVLFVDRKPVGIIEAKRVEEGVHLTVHEDQSKDYASAKLKYINNDTLPFIVVLKTHQIVQEIESRLSICDNIEETINSSLKQTTALR